MSHWHCYWVNMALMLVEGGVNLMRRLEPQTEASQATRGFHVFGFVFITFIIVMLVCLFPNLVFMCLFWLSCVFLFRYVFVCFVFSCYFFVCFSNVCFICPCWSVMYASFDETSKNWGKHTWKNQWWKKWTPKQKIWKHIFSTVQSLALPAFQKFNNQQ